MDFKHFDDAVIANYAIHEIRTRLGEVASYSPPRLTPEERKKAESMFLAFAIRPFMNDNELIAKSGNDSFNVIRSCVIDNHNSSVDSSSHVYTLLFNVIRNAAPSLEPVSISSIEPP